MTKDTQLDRLTALIRTHARLEEVIGHVDQLPTQGDGLLSEDDCGQLDRIQERLTATQLRVQEQIEQLRGEL